MSEGRVRLRGTVGDKQAVLALDEFGLWLMGDGDVDGLDALKEPLRYVRGRLRDALEVRQERYEIPTGSGGEVRRLIALARLRGERLVPEKGPFLDDRSELERAWLTGFLEAGEVLLAFLQTTTKKKVPSEIGDEGEVEARLVWTDQRALLAAIGEFGDVELTPLEGALQVTSETGRDEVRCGEERWRTTLFNEGRYHAVAPFWELPPPRRIRAVLRAALREKSYDVAKSLSETLVTDPIAHVERALLAEGDVLLTEPALKAFVEVMPATDLWSWCDAWNFDAARRNALRALLYEFDSASPHAVALDAVLRVQEVEQTRDLAAQVAIDIAYAKRLAKAGESADAVEVLRQRLGRLASPDAMDLVPHGEGDRDPQIDARVDLLQALCDVGETSALRDLARLEPLSEARVSALEGPRATRLLAILKAGLDGANDPPEVADAFDADALQLLRHPVGRTDEFLAGLQALVAQVDIPDHSALRSFCPRLEQGAAHEVFSAAASRLGMNALAYVSHGDRAIGCRGHDDGDARFVIVGGAHLDPESPRVLPPAGLAFVFGAELAHLRFGHARVTASELWSGAFGMGVSGFDLLLSTVPLLGRWKLGDGVSRLANAVKDGSLGKLVRRAGKAFGVDLESPSEEHLAAGQLLAAHRLMQLTADRVGLVLGRDPGAAIFSMLALDPADLVGEFASAPLQEIVGARNEEGALLRPELAVRISALLSFWLSDDYATLSAS